jgi:TRAP-type transport system periplasmic protein
MIHAPPHGRDRPARGAPAKHHGEVVMAATPIRFGGYQGAASLHTRAIGVFARALEDRLGDEVAVQVSANIAELGHKAADLLQLVESGAFDLCYFSSSYLAKRVPALGMLDLPFAVEARESVFSALEGALGRHLQAAIAKATGYRALAFWDNGIRHLSNRARRIREPGDCVGLRIRTQHNAFHQEFFRALGFEPVAIDPSELPIAVREGRVDAQENPLTNLVNFGIHEHHPHVTLSAHLFGVALVLVNREGYDAWPEAVRRGVHAALDEASAAQHGFAKDDDVTCLARLAETGNRVLQPSAAERAAFAAAVAPVVDVERARIDPDVLKLLDSTA